MTTQMRVMVTGAYGFTGAAIRRLLEARGAEICSLTRRPRPVGSAVRVIPSCFDDPAALAASLEGVDTLYNTYWVRFARGDVTHERAVENSRRLFRAARRAGVRRVVHVSVANSSLDSPLSYYRGKAEVEQDLIDSGLSFAILRPTLLFGERAILLNNIAWLLRRLPVFAIPGRGDYRVQPAHVDDLAGMAASAAEGKKDLVVDVVGPEVYGFRELVERLREAVHSRARLVSVPAWLAYGLSRSLGWVLRDLLLTREELAGLRAGLLVSSAAPTCETRLSDWLGEHGAALGRDYLSELELNYRERSR